MGRPRLGSWTKRIAENDEEVDEDLFGLVWFLFFYLRRIKIERALDAGRHSGQDDAHVAFESFGAAVHQRNDPVGLLKKKKPKKNEVNAQHEAPAFGHFSVKKQKQNQTKQKTKEKRWFTWTDPAFLGRRRTAD